MRLEIWTRERAEFEVVLFIPLVKNETMKTRNWSLLYDTDLSFKRRFYAGFFVE
jgi:hypothetical protein